MDTSKAEHHQSLYSLLEAARAGVDSHSEILNVTQSGNVTLGVLPGRRRVVCVESGQRRSTKVAVGVVSGMEAADVMRVATFAVESANAHFEVRRNAGQIEAYAEQVTSCSEELVWLRELSLQIKQCDVTPEALRELHLTGVLHDIGNIGVSDIVLNKPGRLTDEEFDQIKQHPTIEYQILKPVESLSYVLNGVLHHHENVDGTGYPHGLAGEDIPLDARILAVADAFDAMTSDRPYLAGLPVEKAQSILKEGSGTQWDAEIIQAFFDKLRKSCCFEASASTPDGAIVSTGACR